MKKYLLAASIIVAAPALAYAQCPIGYACGPSYYSPPSYAPTPGQFNPPGLPPVFVPPPPPPPMYNQPTIGGFTSGPIGGYWSGQP
jgi:hypothetical protein